MSNLDNLIKFSALFLSETTSQQLENGYKRLFNNPKTTKEQKHFTLQDKPFLTSYSVHVKNTACCYSFELTKHHTEGGRLTLSIKRYNLKTFDSKAVEFEVTEGQTWQEIRTQARALWAKTLIPIC